jgi:quercetin dioxygenase-like cupin family protein
MSIMGAKNFTGEPIINVNGQEFRAKPGTLSIVRSGEWHELRNDTSADVTILVIQVRHSLPVSS